MLRTLVISALVTTTPANNAPNMLTTIGGCECATISWDT